MLPGYGATDTPRPRAVTRTSQGHQGVCGHLQSQLIGRCASLKQLPRRPPAVTGGVPCHWTNSCGQTVMVNPQTDMQGSGALEGEAVVTSDAPGCAEAPQGCGSIPGHGVHAPRYPLPDLCVKNTGPDGWTRLHVHLAQKGPRRLRRSDFSFG